MPPRDFQQAAFEKMAEAPPAEEQAVAEVAATSMSWSPSHSDERRDELGHDRL
jgi:hypothetical protein